AGRAAELGAERAVPEECVDEASQARVVDLAAEVLEEAVELVEIAEGDRQEVGGVDAGGVGARDRSELGRQLVTEALDPARHLNQIAALELPGEIVGVAESTRRNGAAAVAQLDGEIRGSRARRHPIFADAGKYPLDRAASSQPGDGDAFLGRGRHLSIF